MTGQPVLKNQKKSSKEFFPESKLRVAVVMDAWFPHGKKSHGVWGGGQVHVKQLTQALSKNYPIDFTLFYPAYPHILYRLLWTFIVLIRIHQHHRRTPFSLVHSHGYNSGLAAKLAAHTLNIPVIHTVHGSSLLDTKSKSIKARMEQYLLTKIKYSCQISVAATFLKHSNINSNIHIIPNGVNVAEFDSVEEEKNEEPTLIWVGRNDPVKGLSVLRQAILKIRKKIPNLKAKLVSGGQLHGKALIKAYKRAHVFVLPSLAEGQPITLLEAWAAKLPVVVTDVGDNSKMVKDEVNGYIVEPNNAAQLTNALLKVFRSRTKKTQMGESGYQLVKEHYTWDKVAEQTWEVYTKVINN